MLRAGDPFPDFRLPDHGGVVRHFDNMAASYGLVLYCVESHTDADCLALTREFNSIASGFHAIGYEVVALTRDDRSACCRTIADNDLILSLLPDAPDAVLEQLGALEDGRLVRSIFVVDRAQKVLASYHHSDLPGQGDRALVDLCRKLGIGA